MKKSLYSSRIDIEVFQRIFSNLTKSQFILAILLAIVAIAGVDFVTGVEIRIFPLYFIPLVVASWRFGNQGAFVSSIAATFVWIIVQYLSGQQYSHPWVWLVNFFAQGLAFVAGSLLVARLQIALTQERALSRTDQLTGLANRRSFQEQSGRLLQLCKRNRKPVTLVYLDLDNFKVLNDTQGHARGDQFLQKVASVLRETLRSSDFTARFGGDEFAVLLPETGKDEAVMAMEKVRAKLSETANNFQCKVTASIGGVSYGCAPSSFEQMTNEADQLMYKVKVSTKDRVYIRNIDQLHGE